jgi:hypothetical protein
MASKHRIIFLFSGQSRNSPFSFNVTNQSEQILKSYNDFIFTDEFKSEYDYKIYISTDDVHLENTITYFSHDKIGNIHLHNTGFYLKPADPIADVNTHLDKYNKKDWSYYEKYDNSIFQHYKLLDCYNLYKGDCIQSDYIIRIRLDVIITDNIINLLNLFKSTPSPEIVMCWDLFAIGISNIMECYCNGLNNNYGNYNYNVELTEDPLIMHDYNTCCKKRWTYAPERQLFEMLFEYCNNRKLSINDSIIPVLNCHIVR